ncbi:hypothetical protein CDD81_6904 [Ophiocordyceps australis]|uniref:Uncharacterized protein n=1 Tax=Ophiocordyceps australis TaxID=1399860 RepID=A0A2C5X987_9HYPO|nr:hypothetical protein CDD81_6904 [Ophiocordyceps australis]
MQSFNGHILLKITKSFDPVWNDRGSGGSRNGSFWHPKSEDYYRPVGSVAVPNYDDINGKRFSILLKRNPDANIHGPEPLARPKGYQLIWKDEGSGANENGSLWRPVPHTGYRSLGDVVQKGWEEPDIERIWCVLDEYVQGSDYDRRIWDDTKTKSSKDVSVWEIVNLVEFPSGPPEGVKMEDLIGCWRAKEGHSPYPEHVLARKLVKGLFQAP